MNWWPLIKLLPERTNLRFVSFATVAAALSVFACLASFVSMATGGFRMNPVEVYAQTPGDMGAKLGAIGSQAFNLGIDFRGGTLLEVEHAATPIDVGVLRATVSGLGLGDVQVQSFGDPNHALVRFETPPGSAPAETVDRVKAEVRSAIDGVEFPRVEVVGPKVSGELFASGLMALGLAILMMLIYIWFRFEWQFGIGAVIALFHDVILTLGLFSILRLEFTLTIIAALLTIIGYSMNDTVVVFDRLRENLRKFKKKTLGELIDVSINETLSRTIMTGVTTLVALLGLLLIGGEALFGFALAMFFGVVIGTYSSIYVAAPAILIWGVNRGAADDAKKAQTPTSEASSTWPS